MDKHQRNLVLILVLIGGLVPYALVPLFTELNWNPRDPKYYEKPYQTFYNFSINGETVDKFEFTSSPVAEDRYNVTLTFSGQVVWAIATLDGFWVNGSDVSQYSIFLWFFIENPIQKTLATGKRAWSDEIIPLIDPFGVFGTVNQTYSLKFAKYYIETFPDIATQVSDLYEVYRDGLGAKVGDALYDATCGLCWWFEAFDPVGEQSIKVQMVETNFLISRNRFWFGCTMLVCFAIIGALLLIFMKKKQFDAATVKEIVPLVALGDFAFFIDGVLDIWFTNFFPALIALHVIFLGCVIAYKPKAWRAASVGLIEIAFMLIQQGFMSDVSLVFVFFLGQIGTFMALMAVIHAEIANDSKSSAENIIKN